MNKEELKNIENHRQDLIKENNTLTNLLEIERKQVGRLAEQLNLSGVSQQRELLKVLEYSRQIKNNPKDLQLLIDKLYLENL